MFKVPATGEMLFLLSLSEPRHISIGWNCLSSPPPELRDFHSVDVRFLSILLI